MNASRFRTLRVLVCVVLSLLIFGVRDSSAQVAPGGLDGYRHTYDPEHGYVPYAGGYGGFGGYGGYGGAITPGMGAGIGAGAALSGAGQAAQGVGQMHLSNAQAQEAHQQAVSQYLTNVGAAQETALQTSAKKAQATEQRNEATKAAEKQQIALYQRSLEKMAAAHRLTAEQFDFTRNVLHWPFVLRAAQYTELRNEIDKLYDARTPEDSGTNSSGFDGIQKACKQLQNLVNEECKQGMPVNDFVTANHFISSIEYEARFKVKPAK